MTFLNLNVRAEPYYFPFNWKIEQSTACVIRKKNSVTSDA